MPQTLCDLILDLSGLSENKVVQLPKRTLLIIIHNNLIMHALHLAELELSLCLRKTLLDALVRLCSSASESCLERFEGRWSDEDVAGIEASSFDLLDTLFCVSACVGLLRLRP